MSETMWRSDDWWVSPFNYVDAVRRQLGAMPARVKFHDATLRDGEQTPGVVFTTDEKVRIAGMLDDIGVDRIEVAFPSVSRQDADATRAVVKAGLKADVYVFCRGIESDIDAAADLGVDGIVLELPLGEPRLIYQFSKWDEQTVIEKTLHSVEYAKRKELDVALFPMDCTRSRPEAFDRFLQSVRDCRTKPDSIALVDTTGCLIPQAADYMVRRMREITGLPVEVHTHSDFGLGVSTSIAAVAAGAEVVHASVAGLGERTGNAALEQVAVALKTLMGAGMNIDFSKLTGTARTVAEIARFPLPANKPVVGERAFTRESGLGLNLVFDAPLAMFSMRPEFVGQKAGYVLGKKSGLISVDLKCAELGVPELPGEKKEALLIQIKELSIRKKGLLTDDEFLRLLETVR